jgi:hypothetical protein
MPQTDLHHSPSVIRLQTTPAPLSPLISLLHLHLALQRAPEQPLALYVKGGEETVARICREEEFNAINLNPI